MILLGGGTTDKIQAVTTGTADIHVAASFVDNNAGTITVQAPQGTVITTATTTDVVSASGTSGQVRGVKELSFRNKHASASNGLTVNQIVGTTTVERFKVTLLAGMTLTYTEGLGWQLYDAAGVQMVPAGVPLSVSILTSGTGATYTPPFRCRAIRVRVVGGGGGGAGSSTATSSGSFGGGGGSGGYGEKLVTALAASYTYTIGAGGTGPSSSNGNAGGDTTFAGTGITTVTAKGGNGGQTMAAAATAAFTNGGSGGVAGTGGDVNMPGNAGVYGSRATAALGISGTGGGSVLGSAPIGTANVTGTGTNGTANTGAGGSGASTISAAAAQTGGTGGSGVILIEEYY